MKRVLQSLHLLAVCFALSACADEAAVDGPASTSDSADTAEQVASTEQALVTCQSAGAFASGTATCCKGLVKDAKSRCQYPGCKTAGQAGTVGANGVSTCCIGLVLINGVCRAPTLSPSVCTILGGTPTVGRPCCVGLVKDYATGKCKRNNVLECSASQLAPCCYGTSFTKCNCYCPASYFIGS